MTLVLKGTYDSGSLYDSAFQDSASGFKGDL